jgi:hypothetical protein
MRLLPQTIVWGLKQGMHTVLPYDVAKNPIEAANQTGIDAYRKLQQQQQLLDASNSTIKTAAGMAPQQAQPIILTLMPGTLLSQRCQGYLKRTLIE